MSIFKPILQYIKDPVDQALTISFLMLCLENNPELLNKTPQSQEDYALIIDTCFNEMIRKEANALKNEYKDKCDQIVREYKQKVQKIISKA